MQTPACPSVIAGQRPVPQSNRDFRISLKDYPQICGCCGEG